MYIDFREFDEKFPYSEYYPQKIEQARISGHRLTGLCPFHDDKTASFSVNLKNGMWKCHAHCTPGNHNTITFHAMTTGQDTKAAFRELCVLYNFPEYIKQLDEKAHAGPAKVIDESVWEQMAPLPDDWAQTLAKLKGWSAEVIKAMDLRQQSVFQDKGSGEIKPLKRPERVAIPIRDGKKRLVNIKLYHPNPPKDTDRKVAKNYPWGEGHKTRVFYPHPKNLPDFIKDEGPIYVVEGEPDLLCALSIGLNARTPLSNAKSWPKSELKMFEGRDVIVIPDMDTPGMIRAATVGNEIKKVARSVQLLHWTDAMGRDPLSGAIPEKHGKDLSDYIVKMGHTVEELLDLPLDELPAVEDVNPKTAAAPPDQPTVSRKENNSYYRIKHTTQGQMETDVISNFVLDFTRLFHTPDHGLIREVKLTNKAGQTKAGLVIEPQSMASKRAFQEWLYRQGNFIWYGTLSDIEAVMDFEFSRSDPREVIQPNHVGWIEKEKLWLFEGFGVLETGQVVLADDDGIVWVDEQGFQAIAPSMDEEVGSLQIPRVRADLSDERIDQIRRDFIRLIKQNVNNPAVYLCLGYVAMCAYLRELFPEYASPILSICGEHEVGKNYLAAMVVEHFGLSALSASNIREDSFAGLARKMAYFSNVPVWVDEFRAHEPGCQSKESILRSAYDRISAARGTLSFKFGSSPVRSPLIITGEALTEDSALMSRCAQVYLSTRDRNDDVIYEINEIRPYLSAIFYKFLKEKTPAKTAKLLDDIAQTKTYLRQKNHLHAREAGVYAVLLECFWSIYNPEDINQDRGSFSEWILSSTQKQQKEKRQKSELWEFMEEAQGLVAEGIINGSYIRHDAQSQRLYIWFTEVIKFCQKSWRSRGKGAWGEQTIRARLEEQPWFIDWKTYRIAGTPRRCCELDVKMMPEELSAGLLASPSRNY